MASHTTAAKAAPRVSVSVPADGLLTRVEAAALLRVSLDGIDKFIQTDEHPIPVLRAGRRFLFDRDEVIAWARESAQRSRKGGE